jgi:histidinol dehydrogenase
MLLRLPFLILSSAPSRTNSLFILTRSMTTTQVLNRITPDKVALEIKDPVDPTALGQAKAIIDDLMVDGYVGSENLLKVAKRLKDVPADATTFVVSKEECKAAFEGLSDQERTALVNIHGRVKAFADMQRTSVADMEMDIPGGKAGHIVSPCKGTYVEPSVESLNVSELLTTFLYLAAGCYAPGGRYPLPSSVLMTAVTARAAGCETVVLASPRPAKITMAAAHISNVDLFLCVGGAQAIASMAYGIKDLVPRCDVICGPGNKWVTAAKSLVNGKCGIDMLAGPSEVLVICDETANAKVVAADLIAQAEHDVVARAILLSTDSKMIEMIDKEVADQIEALPEPNRSTALEALKQSFAVQCSTIEECVAISDAIAPEHLEIQTVDAQKVAESCGNYGGLFIGEHAAEVLGDYGAGPNHTLPTGGTGRYTGGLSVFNFLRIRTWMRVDDAKKSQGMVDDSVVMARLEGLEGHARAAEARKQ